MINLQVANEKLKAKPKAEESLFRSFHKQSYKTSKNKNFCLYTTNTKCIWEETVSAKRFKLLFQITSVVKSYTNSMLNCWKQMSAAILWQLRSLALKVVVIFACTWHQDNTKFEYSYENLFRFPAQVLYKYQTNFLLLHFSYSSFDKKKHSTLRW